ncbi:hypothetical protein GCM10019059_10870 [Camelimonas fluminis]|uniref:Cysteine rich repeat protein n=1 Tax=Camelimonas fluminis TaxID=1576911 RepID=A0ABV7UKD2_9HYPH|nr:hypothetical protein [Camelimonas fluminis]GHE53569.1 hypothetical protein GCM10019059_10870 [Camelimonas fluminis]
MKKALFLAVVLAAASNGAVMAEDARTACRADAQKLCASAIGNRDQVASCLKTNKDKLSDGCKQALAAR